MLKKIVKKFVMEICFLCNKCKGKLDFKEAKMVTLYSWIGHQDFRAILSDRPRECASAYIGDIIELF